MNQPKPSLLWVKCQTVVRKHGLTWQCSLPAGHYGGHAPPRPTGRTT